MFNKLKIKLLFNSLEELNLTNDEINILMQSNIVKNNYKDLIEPFIKDMQNKKIENKTIKNQLLACSSIKDQKALKEYISFTQKYGYENIYKNIIDLINKGKGEKLFKLLDMIYDPFLKKLKGLKMDEINNNIFTDQNWNIINTGKVDDLDLFKIFNYDKEKIVKLINNNYLSGFIYTYKNIPESHDFIRYSDKSFRQFDQNFIKNIGLETLRKMYKDGIFYDQKAQDKIFELAKANNYELINDMINYYYDYNYGSRNNSFNFFEIKDDEINKTFFELDFVKNSLNEYDPFLYKYCGLSAGKSKYIKYFLDAMSKLDYVPEEFQNNYYDIYSLLNDIYKASPEQLIDLSKKMNVNDRLKYKQIIEEFEKDGNNLLKKEFTDELKSRKEKISQKLEKKNLNTTYGNIPYYDLKGEDFTMLVHCVALNNLSEYNDLSKKILDNPAEFDNIKEGNNYLSTSLISNKHMAVYDGAHKGIVLGFDNIPSDSLKLMSVIDAGINRTADKNLKFKTENKAFDDNANIVIMPDDLIDRSYERNKSVENKMWNEIIISRTSQETGQKIEPSYIVCFNKIDNNSIKAAKYFNVPIYVIHKEYYKKYDNLKEENHEIKNNIHR